MVENIFKIYNGDTGFYQWQTKQKLIVLDDSVLEVRFSNKNMEHSKRRPVYTDESGLRVCNIPDLVLQLPCNLIATAYTKNSDGAYVFVKEVKFAVYKQPLPSNYVCEVEEEYASDAPVQLGTVEEWNASLVPVRNGVLCFATSVNPETNESVFMVKVGDGVRTFRDLPWSYCNSEANVIEACKSEESLKQFIHDLLGEIGVGTDDTLNAITSRVDVLESVVGDDGSGIVHDIYVHEALIDALSKLVGTTSVSGQISDAIVALDLDGSYASKAHVHSKNDISDFSHTHELSNIIGLQEELDELEDRVISSGGAVKSVNGKTGEVVLTAADVGAATLDDKKDLEDAIASIQCGSTARIGYITILADAWVGDESPYAQVVDVDGATKNSQVDLTPNVAQLAVFYNKDLAFVTENENGIVTVYAIGQKPTNDYTVQVTITEVVR